MTAATTAQVQTWIAVVGGLATAILGILKYFDFRTHRERAAMVGQAFAATVDALASKESARQLAGAICCDGSSIARQNRGRGMRRMRRRLLPSSRRFCGMPLPATCRSSWQMGWPMPRASNMPISSAATFRRPTSAFVLTGASILSRADFFEANLSGASLKGAKAHGTVFFQAVLHDTVLSESDLDRGRVCRGGCGLGARGSREPACPGCASTAPRTFRRR